MNVSDIPPEVREWLMEQKKPYSIFFRPAGDLALVSGVATPYWLWEYYHHGNIQSWLEGEGKDGPNLEDYEESFIIRTENPSFDVTEIAEILGVPKRSIYDFVKHASMPHFREGRKLKFRLLAVMHWRAELMRDQESRWLASKELPE